MPTDDEKPVEWRLTGKVEFTLDVRCLACHFPVFKIWEIDATAREIERTFKCPNCGQEHGFSTGW